MTGGQFTVAPADESAVQELGGLLPSNPFATPGFFEARRRLGATAWVLGVRDATGALTSGCGAFLLSGKLHRSLEILSLPSVEAVSPFWSGLRAFCRDHGVTQLELGTFASPPGTEIPSLEGQGARRSRREFLLDLTKDRSAAISTNHKRNVKKAQKAGLTVARSRTGEAAKAHRELMNRSMDRRRTRGENVGSSTAAREDSVFLTSGAGELFQAFQDATTLSSVLVLRAPLAGYYHSAGTSPEGMAVGASHFLIDSIANQLQSEGAHTFNLGGADEDSSLARFKEGFGASRVPLVSASWSLGPAWRRWVSRLLAHR